MAQLQRIMAKTKPLNSGRSARRTRKRRIGDDLGKRKELASYWSIMHVDTSASCLSSSSSISEVWYAVLRFSRFKRAISSLRSSRLRAKMSMLPHGERHARERACVHARAL